MLQLKENLWNETRFNSTIKAIRTETEKAGKKAGKDLTEYSIYGAFHSWKANNTNFHEIATAIMEDETLSNKEQNHRYYQLVLEIASEWMNWAKREDIDIGIASTILKRYITSETGKIHNWITKQIKFERIN